jgi:hypothetical protein
MRRATVGRATLAADDTFEVVKRRARKVSAVVALALGVAGISGTSEGCRTATQVELVVTYDGMCTDLQEVAFIIGTDPGTAEGRIESNVFTTTTSHCEQGSPSRVGTLVVTPSDATGRASIIVLASFGQHVSECKPEKGYAGCIIARRAFAFVDHSALTLEIALERSCKDVPCDAVSTCKHASCVNSSVGCSGSGCSEVGVSADGGTELVNAPMSPGEYVQAHPDAAPPTMPDASTADAADGAPDAALEAAPGRCYPYAPVTCSANGAAGGTTCSNSSDVCCQTFPLITMDAMPTTNDYACRSNNSCYTSMSQGSGTVVRCRSARNCPGAQVCCLNMMFNGGESMCMDSCQFSMGFDSGPVFPQACESACECRNGKACSTPQTPNGVQYETCDP